eukprot:TRINITY_DN91633_c0_g1_i1.p1 TRINITY_DN91633_c0_g1~~TRINITY_DN91633_c0_g1_i1.p1  ORF type:complete len:451 (-),score=89.27 TRINITY_DN91633_c0_g1_i1:297-1649(-)
MPIELLHPFTMQAFAEPTKARTRDTWGKLAASRNDDFSAEVELPPSMSSHSTEAFAPDTPRMMLLLRSLEQDIPPPPFSEQGEEDDSGYRSGSEMTPDSGGHSAQPPEQQCGLRQLQRCVYTAADFFCLDERPTYWFSPLPALKDGSGLRKGGKQCSLTDMLVALDMPLLHPIEEACCEEVGYGAAADNASEDECQVAMFKAARWGCNSSSSSKSYSKPQGILGQLAACEQIVLRAQREQRYLANLCSSECKFTVEDFMSDTIRQEKSAGAAAKHLERVRMGVRPLPVTPLRSLAAAWQRPAAASHIAYSGQAPGVAELRKPQTSGQQQLQQQPGPSRIPSVGSAVHHDGTCRPCIWFWKESGCINGLACRHCHTCPPGAARQRRKQKRDLGRQRRSVAMASYALGSSHHDDPDRPFSIPATDEVPQPKLAAVQQGPLGLPCITGQDLVA